MTGRLFEAALGVALPWQVTGTVFDASAKMLTIHVDFVAGSRFAVAEAEGQHPVQDTVAKRYRHLNFFQHNCFLEVRVPLVKLPWGAECTRSSRPGQASSRALRCCFGRRC